MSKKSVLFSVFLLLASPLWAQEVPELVDITLNNSQAPYFFEPLEVNLQKDVTYLMVLKNNSPREVTFVCKDLKNAVYTQFIQGSPSVSQDRVSIRGHGRVQWLMKAKEPGKFEFYEAASEFSHQGAKIGKIMIQDPSQTTAQEQHIAELVLAKLAEKEKNHFQAQVSKELREPSQDATHSTTQRPRFKGGRRD